jgi:hypothetical protein
MDSFLRFGVSLVSLNANDTHVLALDYTDGGLLLGFSHSLRDGSWCRVDTYPNFIPYRLFYI